MYIGWNNAGKERQKKDKEFLQNQIMRRNLVDE
jgi:hypothetical protein